MKYVHSQSKGWIVLLGSASTLIGILLMQWSRSESYLIATFTTNAPVETVAISTNSQYLAAGNQQGTILIWSRDNASPRATIRAHQGSVTTLVFSPDDQTLASGGQDGVVRLWNVATGQATVPPVQIIPNHSRQAIPTPGGIQRFQGGITDVVFSPDSQTLAVGAAGSQIVILQRDTGTVKFALRGRPVLTTPGNGWNIGRLAFRPDGRQLASVAQDSTVILWDMQTGTQVASFDTRSAGLTKAIRFSPDGQELTFIPSNDDVQIWSFPATQRTWFGFLPVGDVASADVSVDAHLLARGGPVRGGTFLERLPFIGKPNTDIYLARLRNPIPTNQDGYCSIPPTLDATEFQSTPCPRIDSYAILRGHHGLVSSVMFSPDAKWLVSGSWDNTVRLWRVP